MGNKLDALQRKKGSIQPKTAYDERKGTDWNSIGNNISKRERNTSKKNGTDKRATLKISKELKQKIEAQKQIMGLKFDYQVIETLLEHNFETFSDSEKSMYKVLLEVYNLEK